MVDKVSVTDVEKLRPELLTKSYNELQRMKAEIEMAMNSKAAEEEAKKRAAVIEETNTIIDSILAGMKRLDELGTLPPSVREAFTTKGRGDAPQFSPHLKFRKPSK